MMCALNSQQQVTSHNQMANNGPFSPMSLEGEWISPILKCHNSDSIQDIEIIFTPI